MTFNRMPIVTLYLFGLVGSLFWSFGILVFWPLIFWPFGLLFLWPLFFMSVCVVVVCFYFLVGLLLFHVNFEKTHSRIHVKMASKS